MSFFRIKSSKLEVDLEYVLFYKEFKNIYNSDNTPEKAYAKKLFMYIYEVCDYKSYANRNNFSKAKAHKHAVNLAGLDSDFEPTGFIAEGIKAYKKLNYNINAELLRDLKATLLLSIQINDKIYKAIELELQNDDLPRDSIGAIINLQGKLFELIDGLPNKINKVKELEAEVYEELSKPKEEARGGGEVIDSYEGNPEIEGI